MKAENTELKNQLANQKPTVDIDITIYTNRIKELESKLATAGVDLLAKDKEIEVLKSTTPQTDPRSPRYRRGDLPVSGPHSPASWRVNNGISDI